MVGVIWHFFKLRHLLVRAFFFVLSTCVPTSVLPVVPDVVLGNEQPGGHLGVDRGHHQQEYEKEPHLGGQG